MSFDLGGLQINLYVQKYMVSFTFNLSHCTTTHRTKENGQHQSRHLLNDKLNKIYMVNVIEWSTYFRDNKILNEQQENAKPNKQQNLRQ